MKIRNLILLIIVLINSIGYAQNCQVNVNDLKGIVLNDSLIINFSLENKTKNPIVIPKYDWIGGIINEKKIPPGTYIQYVRNILLISQTDSTSYKYDGEQLDLVFKNEYPCIPKVIVIEPDSIINVKILKKIDTNSFNKNEQYRISLYISYGEYNFIDHYLRLLEEYNGVLENDYVGKFYAYEEKRNFIVLNMDHDFAGNSVNTKNGINCVPCIKVPKKLKKAISMGFTNTIYAKALVEIIK